MTDTHEKTLVPWTTPFLFKFDYEGKEARLFVRDGEIVYEGDIPVAESGRLLFEEFFKQAKTNGVNLEPPLPST